MKIFTRFYFSAVSTKIINISAANVKTSTPITPVQLRVVSKTGGSACETDGVIVGGEVGDGLEVVISIAVLVGVKIAAWVG